MARTNVKLIHKVAVFPSCCGVEIVHNMKEDGYVNDRGREVKPKYLLANRRAQIAITAPYQTQQIRRLKKAGFKAVKQFVNTGSGRKLTLWFAQV